MTEQQTETPTYQPRPDDGPTPATEVHRPDLVTLGGGRGIRSGDDTVGGRDGGAQVAGANSGGSPVAAGDGGGSPMSSVTKDPAELIRIGTMLSRLNTELREIDLDAASADRLHDMHHQVLTSLEGNLDAPLVAELHRFVPALDADDRSESEVRIAHLQLMGWMEGLFQGIQLLAVGQQMEGRPAPPQIQSSAPTSDGVYL